jgi:hypothetical protein
MVSVLFVACSGHFAMVMIESGVAFFSFLSSDLLWVSFSLPMLCLTMQKFTSCEYDYRLLYHIL